MKHLSKLLAIALLVSIGSTAMAQQSYKFGHINASELMLLMPERDSAQVQLETARKDLEERLEALQVEFNNKLSVYQSSQAKWTAAVLEDKQAELQNLGQRIEEFQRKSQEDLQRMQQSLLRPIIEKANNAITKVGKDNGFIYIFDVSAGAVPYFDVAQSTDVLPLVKAELKIPADKKVPVPVAAPAR